MKSPLQAQQKMTLFTGSSRVAEKLAQDLRGRVKLEDAGFDWKILGPDVRDVRFFRESSSLGMLFFICDFVPQYEWQPFCINSVI